MGQLWESYGKQSPRMWATMGNPTIPFGRGLYHFIPFIYGDLVMVDYRVYHILNTYSWNT